MAKADVLFWQEDHMLGMKDNNRRITIISPDKIGALTVYIMDEGDHLIKYIKEAKKHYLQQRSPLTDMNLPILI